MGRPDDVAQLIREGNTLSDVAVKLDVSIKSVEGYAHRAIGEGLIRRSDVFFSVPPDRRNLDATMRRRWGDAIHALGDMYEDLRRIEITVHDKICRALIEQYGEGESGWWRKGVPERVRIKCQERREEDQDEPCDPFCYSDLLDLAAILEDQWSLLKNLFPEYAANRRQLLKDLRQFNRLRNKVMHPVRGLVPDEQDFDFVRGLQRSFQCERPYNR
jgi:hypothetical protein